MTNTTEQSSLGTTQQDEPDFSLKEKGLKAKISRENTRSPRFSESNLKIFRESAKSFRSNVTISSTASSPGYTLKGEIDPSTYSFSTALKALQAKNVYTWEYISPDGLTLNSKWNDAEKYICNPLSGEVPLECLSAKTLSGRSFRRITMSAPLIYPSPNMHHIYDSKSPISQHQSRFHITSQVYAEKKRTTTRDVGTQSTPVDLSSSSPSPAPTPSVEESSIKISDTEYGDSSISSEKPMKSETKSRSERNKRETVHKKKWRREKEA
ncbi:hypothetical protein OROHE_019807 [Orobanche hederae]